MSQNNKKIIRINKFISNSGICSRRQADELILKGKVYLNNKKVKNLFRLKIDDIIDIHIELKKKTISKKKISFSSYDFNHLKKNFIFECDDYCILNKPYGYASQGGSKVKKNVIFFSGAVHVKARDESLYGGCRKTKTYGK